MGEFKIGDEVLIDGMIIDIDEKDKYTPFLIRIDSDNELWFSEDDFKLAPKNKTELQTLPHDAVENPSHYQGRHGLEAIEVHRNFMKEEQVVGYHLGNTLKYLLRYQNKNGLEDLKKAKVHLEWLIKEYEKE